MKRNEIKWEKRNVEEIAKNLDIYMLEFPEGQDHTEYHRIVEMNTGKPH